MVTLRNYSGWYGHSLGGLWEEKKKSKEHGLSYSTMTGHLFLLLKKGSSCPFLRGMFAEELVCLRLFFFF